MATYTAYIEASAASPDGTVTGSGLSADPWIGRGDDVIAHAFNNVLITWGAGVSGNPAWADGDTHVVNFSNKEPYLFYDTANDAISLNSTWTGSDTPRRTFLCKAWETTTQENSGTFIDWYNGSSTVCAEIDGQRLAQQPFAIISVGSDGFDGFKIHNFTVRAIDSSSNVVRNSEFYNFDTEAIDNGAGPTCYNCWFHDGYDTSSVGHGGPTRNLFQCLFEGQMIRAITAFTGVTISNCVFIMDDSWESVIDIANNQFDIMIRDCIFISTGAANKVGITCSGSGARNVMIINNLFVNFSGASAYPIDDGGFAGIYSLIDNNYYYNCPNGNNVTSLFGFESGITLTENPIINSSGKDCRLILSESLKKICPVFRNNIWMNPVGAVDDDKLFTAGGYYNSHLDLPTRTALD